MSKFDAAISLMECALDGLPKKDKDVGSLRAAIRVLEAAAKVEHYFALCALDEPQMPEKGTESWRDWIKGQKQLREFIAALPDKEEKP